MQDERGGSVPPTSCQTNQSPASTKLAAASKAARSSSKTCRAFGFAWSFLCLITPLCSYLYGGLYRGLYEKAHIIRYFLTCRAFGSSHSQPITPAY
jgi:hypothetical protein